MLKTSIIIPIFNKTEHLIQCLDSLKIQTVKEFEVIIVDDGSNPPVDDKKLNIELKSKLENFKIIRQRHKGAGSARNAGAKEACGKILIFVDADMYFDKDFIQQLIKPIENGLAKGTFSKNEFVANWHNIWSRCWNFNFGLPGKQKIPTNYPDNSPVFRAILKSEFIKVKGFDNIGYADDWTLSTKLGYQSVSAPGALYYHYNPDSLIGIFKQAKWRAKRDYKYGWSGVIIQAAIHLLPFSIIRGFWGILRYREPEFFIFTLVFDCGTFIGILEKNLGLNNY